MLSLLLQTQFLRHRFTSTLCLVWRVPSWPLRTLHDATQPFAARRLVGAVVPMHFVGALMDERQKKQSFCVFISIFFYYYITNKCSHSTFSSDSFCAVIWHCSTTPKMIVNGWWLEPSTMESSLMTRDRKLWCRQKLNECSLSVYFPFWVALFLYLIQLNSWRCFVVE